jgi:YgiT-type zinc finger domain-containing protein
MTDESAVPSGHEIGAQIFAELQRWRQTHPKATFAEIESAVETQLDTLRAALLQQELELRAQAEAAPTTAPPHCPSCGQPLERRGTRERAVTVQGNRPVRLHRRYFVCPSCGAGHFPPG